MTETEAGPAEAIRLNLYRLGDAGGPFAEPWRECRKESQELEFIKSLVSSLRWGVGNVGVGWLVNVAKGQFGEMLEGKRLSPATEPKREPIKSEE